jgi:hypothetical protein
MKLNTIKIIVLVFLFGCVTFTLFAQDDDVFSDLEGLEEAEDDTAESKSTDDPFSAMDELDEVEELGNERAVPSFDEDAEDMDESEEVEETQEERKPTQLKEPFIAPATVKEGDTFFHMFDLVFGACGGLVSIADKDARFRFGNVNPTLGIDFQTLFLPFGNLFVGYDFYQVGAEVPELYSNYKIYTHYFSLGFRFYNAIGIADKFQIIPFAGLGFRMGLTVDKYHGYRWHTETATWYEEQSTDSFVGVGGIFQLGVTFYFLKNLAAYTMVSYGIIGVGKTNTNLDGLRFQTGALVRIR